MFGIINAEEKNALRRSAFVRFLLCVSASVNGAAPPNKKYFLLLMPALQTVRDEGELVQLCITRIHRLGILLPFIL